MFVERINWLGITLLLACTSLVAQDEPSAAANRRPKIGLVFSGGGARGAAHIGVLKRLEELRIPVDFVTGTSMGAVVGGFYAVGRSPAWLEETFTRLEWGFFLQDKPPRDNYTFSRKREDLLLMVDFELGISDWGLKLPKGLIQGQNLGFLLQSLFANAFRYTDFDALPIPFRAVAADIETGQRVVLGQGNLARSVQASMSVPGAFAPVLIDGRELVDGMIVSNVPVDVVQGMGAEVLIVVDIGSPLLKAAEIASLLNVTEQVLTILMKRSRDEQLAKMDQDRDILILPELGDITSSDFGRVNDAMVIGYEATESLSGALSHLSVSEEEYRRFLASQRRDIGAPPIVDEIIIENNSEFADTVIEARMDMMVGKRLDYLRLKRNLQRVYGTQIFETLAFQLQAREEGHAALQITARAKSWGPNILRFGLRLSDDFRGNALYTIHVNSTWSELNSYGGTWRNTFTLGTESGLSSEFYQPMDPRGDTFIALRVAYDKAPSNLYLDGARFAHFTKQEVAGSLDVGMQFATRAELRVGVLRSTGRVAGDFASSTVSGYDFEDGMVYARLSLDTLDSSLFPRTGELGKLEWGLSTPELGADDRHEIVGTKIGMVRSAGLYTFGVNAEFQATVAGTLPLHRMPRLGGLFSLSGLRRDELIGQHVAAGRIFAWRHMSGQRDVLLGMPVFLGASLELGNTWDRREDIFSDMRLAGSAFLGIDSPLGPVHFAFGVAEGGRNSGYLFLGRIF